MHLLTLIFGIVLLPKAYTLKCYECAQDLSGNCPQTEKQCPLQGQECGAIRIISYTGGAKVVDVNSKSCVLLEECFEGSVNYGISKTVFTSKCCKTDLCNTQPAPEPGKSTPNGMKCFTCNGENCTATLNCEGSEDRCISASVTVENQKLTFKGCASKQMCLSTPSTQIPGIESEVKCCEGNFCNSASGTSAGLLLLVAPLMSLGMFL